MIYLILVAFVLEGSALAVLALENFPGTGFHNGG